MGGVTSGVYYFQTKNIGFVRKMFVFLFSFIPLFIMFSFLLSPPCGSPLNLLISPSHFHLSPSASLPAFLFLYYLSFIYVLHFPDICYTSMSSPPASLSSQALDRDPPSGRRIWKIKVRVRDGQPPWGRPHASPLGSVRRRYPRQRSQEDPQDTEATGREDTQQDTGRKNSQVLLRKSSHTKRHGVVFQGKRREVRRKNERLDAGVHIEGRQNDAAEGPAVEGKTAISRKGFVERGTSGLGDADDDGPSDSVMSRTITKEDNYSQHSTNNRDEATVREVSVPSDPAGSAKTAANAAGGTTATEDPPKTLPDGAVSEDPPGARKTRNAFEILEKHTDTEAEPCTSLDTLNGRGRGGHGREGGRRGRVHEAETTVTVIVKDINDNFPVFPNATMYAEVQENGPVGKWHHGRRSPSKEEL